MHWNELNATVAAVGCLLKWVAEAETTEARKLLRWSVRWCGVMDFGVTSGIPFRFLSFLLFPLPNFFPASPFVLWAGLVGPLGLLFCLSACLPRHGPPLASEAPGFS